MNAGLQPAEWHDFFVGALSASGALLGLVLVAMSLRLRGIETSALVRSRARTTLSVLVLAITVSLAALTPQPLIWLGVEIVAFNAMYLALALAWTIGIVRMGQMTRAGMARAVIFNLPAGGFAVACGASLVAQSGPGLFLLLPSFLLLVPLVTYLAWIVLFAPELPAGHRRRET